MDTKMNNLLRWSIENTAVPDESDATSKPTQESEPVGDTSSGIDREVFLSALLGGPSEADLMREAMAAIKSSEVNLENKLIAFDNMEQLVESLDNANNMESLRLWRPLIQELENDDAQMRLMAAWCLGTAVQNNDKSQERLLSHGGLTTLVQVAMKDNDLTVAKKASRAISSASRNYQPGLDHVLSLLPHEDKPAGPVNANDMEAVDRIIQTLRDIRTRMY